MNKKHRFILLLAIALLVAPATLTAKRTPWKSGVVTGDLRTKLYLPMLKGQRVALFSNHTGLAGKEHVLDLLLRSGVNVACIFSPEHGFRGTADAGEVVGSSTDDKTGVTIVSLYGQPLSKALASAPEYDVLVADIQDVGLRYYTYYVTLCHLMDACADRDKPVIVLDRPNPNGHYVDGPILDMTLRNLPNLQSILLYASLCYFEATDVSVGRGTDKPFQIYGHPELTNLTYRFRPQSGPGAKRPTQQDNWCFGEDLSQLPLDSLYRKHIDLTYLVNTYLTLSAKNQTEKRVLTSFFEKLIGSKKIRAMLDEGLDAKTIAETWKDDVKRFKEQRKPYLLYKE